jgi:hypothetical protein
MLLWVAGTPSGGCTADVVNTEPAPLQRLRARTFEFEGGATALRSWFDPELGEACAFAPRATLGGVEYCLPTEPPLRGYGTLYADEACTEELVVRPLEGPFTPVIERAADRCAGGLPTVFALGERAGTVAYGRWTGTCRAYDVPDRALFRGRGAQIPLSRFVRAVATIEPAGERIAALTLAADDGSRQIIAGYDRERGESVQLEGFGEAFGGEARWWPRQVAFRTGPAFADAACTRPAAYNVLYSAICPITAVISFEQGSRCGLSLVHYTAGAAVETSYTQGADGACTPAIGSDEAIHHEVGELIPPTALAAATTVDRGSGRMRARFAASTDGVPVMPAPGGLFFDTGRDLECEVVEAIDGRWRCLPHAGSGFVVFGDAACTAPVFVFGTQAGCVPASAPRALRDGDGRAYAVGERLHPTTLFSQNDQGGCHDYAEDPSSWDPATAQVYALTELAPESFAEATVRD